MARTQYFIATTVDGFIATGTRSLHWLAAAELTLTDCHYDGTFAYLTYAVRTGQRP